MTAGAPVLSFEPPEAVANRRRLQGKMVRMIHSETRLALAALLALGCAACAETPLDATLLETGSDGSGSPPPVCPTDAPAPGVSYFIIAKSTGSCLTAGAVTEIELSTSTTDATGYTVEFSSPCRDVAEQRWGLVAEQFGEWSIRNEALDLNVDLEGGRFFDGTEALLYTPHTMSNQRFTLVPRGDSDYQIRASLFLTSNSCLQAMTTGENAVTLQGCGPAASQLWMLSPALCD